MRRRLKAELTAVLEVPPDRAEQTILDVTPGPPGSGRVWLLGDSVGEVEGGPERFTVRQDGYPLTVHLDRSRRTIAVQGGWWYRAEYTLEPENGHTALVLRVYNVAGAGSRWLVPLANRFFIGFQEQTRARFADTVRDVGQRLGCRAYPR
ncbi:hypothetical protein LX16_0360 [Stackebrandtia albiflava]|uniref:Polyketide cyclase/dehydrase/lipid transport protein n=1 Tax=Stackebrandtia albiflava TaxID=406432 RepID=A0A562V9Z3_9ACTN|nr:hypothetical protein [Stackebrandtia albiflava]TWJ14673.1 hypothetical protein LX16_0360 [Stackebrandtia albiflava]